MRRAKHLAFYFSLIPVLCARILIFWTGKMPSTVAGICFIGYKVCYLIAVVLFIIGRKDLYKAGLNYAFVNSPGITSGVNGFVYLAGF